MTKKSWHFSYITILVAILVVIGTYNIYNQGPKSNTINISFSDFVKDVESKSVDQVQIVDNRISGLYKNGIKFTTLTPYQDTELIKRLIHNNVDIHVHSSNDNAGYVFLQLFAAFPTLLWIGMIIFIMRQSGQRGGSFGIGKSRAKMFDESNDKVTFDDVAGIPEAKSDLVEIVDFLKEPEKFRKMGARIPRGVLLAGPPGTGKTLLAKSIAGEANVVFLSISGSDFVEMFVGIGASRVRDLFEQAKEHAPCIVFIDEIDALGRNRSSGVSGGHDEREQTLNQLLVEMDGFENNEGVVIIAATNRADILDPALLRPGRFDRLVHVTLPDMKGREAILKVHLKNVKTSNDNPIDLKKIAKGTPGFSGAHLKNLVNESALLAARLGDKYVAMDHFEEMKDKIIMGAKRSTIMTDDEKKMTAYHESGHALVSFYSPASDPIHKLTIIPRGHALGMLVTLPERDKVSETREELLSNLAVAMGGRVAELKIFGESKVTTGASSDLQYATKSARNMVIHYGMSDRVGSVYYQDNNENPMQVQHISEYKLQIIDEEVKRLVDAAEKSALEILDKHIDQLHLLASYLIQHETLTGIQIKELLETGSLKIIDSDEEKVIDSDEEQSINSDEEKVVSVSENEISSFETK